MQVESIVSILKLPSILLTPVVEIHMEKLGPQKPHKLPSVSALFTHEHRQDFSRELTPTQGVVPAWLL